jgi:hypothetical protein
MNEGNFFRINFKSPLIQALELINVTDNFIFCFHTDNHLILRLILQFSRYDNRTLGFCRLICGRAGKFGI